MSRNSRVESTAVWPIDKNEMLFVNEVCIAKGRTFGVHWCGRLRPLQAGGKQCSVFGNASSGSFYWDVWTNMKYVNEFSLEGLYTHTPALVIMSNFCSCIFASQLFVSSAILLWLFCQVEQVLEKVLGIRRQLRCFFSSSTYVCLQTAKHVTK